MRIFLPSLCFILSLEPQRDGAASVVALYWGAGVAKQGSHCFLPGGLLSSFSFKQAQISKFQCLHCSAHRVKGFPAVSSGVQPLLLPAWCAAELHSNRNKPTSPAGAQLTCMHAHGFEDIFLSSLKMFCKIPATPLLFSEARASY